MKRNRSLDDKADKTKLTKQQKRDLKRNKTLETKVSRKRTPQTNEDSSNSISAYKRMEMYPAIAPSISSINIKSFITPINSEFDSIVKYSYR